MSTWRTKHRPTEIESFIGNSETVETFVTDVKNKKERSFFISGPHGIGKTTLARIGAKNFLDIDDFNITEINASDDRGIDAVRELIKNCSISTPVNRAWILDEFQETTKAFQNAILKLLEEGSTKDFFFICTTDPSKIIGTIKSRCGKYPLELPTDIEIKKRLRVISKLENIMVSPEVTAKILEKAEGHVRDAVGFLQSVSEMEEDKAIKYLDKVVGGEASSPEAFELVKAIYNKKNKTVKDNLKSLKTAGESPEGIRRFIMSYGASILLNRWNVDTALIMENFESPYFDSSPWPKFILDCYRAMESSS